MITATASSMVRCPQPTKLDDGPGLVEEFAFDSDMTRYRVVLVTAGPEEVFVLVEPCSFKADGPRRWFPLSGRGAPMVSMDYVAEKLGLNAHGEDADNLTRLIAFALNRPAIVYDATLNDYVLVERIDE